MKAHRIDSDFALDPRLAADTLPLLELGLSSLRLMNDARYPWIVLVPRVDGVVEILDLPIPDQLRLWDEIRLTSHVLREETGCEKLNIASLGNQVPQLHVHVIARFASDEAWPAPVWGVHPPRPYAPEQAQERIHRLATAIRG
ncbi:MAG: HIT family protein [Gemmatimonadales bacterium]|nr:MAG: HIT family protein [Gemmatimonadales bacterium]